MKLSLTFALLGALVLAVPAAAQTVQDGPKERRTRITVHPQDRPLSPNAKRECTAWLEKEYRVSGPVIVPRQRCFWRN